MIYWIEKRDFGCYKEHCTYKIKCSGVYKLKENISFNPKKNKVPAILIDSDNVVLDLNSKVLKQSSHNDKTQITGILVKTGHKNVTIIGNYGVIKNFSQRGIYVEGGNDYVTIGDESLLTIRGCGYGTPVAFVDTYKGVQEGITQGGLQLGDQEFIQAIGAGEFKGFVNQVTVRNVVSSENNVGCLLGEGSNYSFSNCSFSSNREVRLMWDKISVLGGFYKGNSVVCYGLVYFSNPDVTPPPNFGVNNIVFENCNFNSNVADASVENALSAYCHGKIMAVNFKNLKVINCQYNSNQTILGDAGENNETIGLVLGAGAGTVIQNSEFSQNEGGSLCIGFSLSGLMATTLETKNAFPGESVTIKNCVSSGNVGKTGVSNITTVDVRGLSVKYPSGVNINDCVCEDNRVLLTDDNKENVAGFCDGLFIFSDRQFPETFTNNVMVKNSKFSRNRVVNAGPNGTSSGIRVFDDLCENILISDCFISNNLPDFDEPAPEVGFLTTGIDLFNEGEKTGPSYVSVLNNAISSNGQVGIDNNLDITTIQGNKFTNHNINVLLSTCDCGMVIENSFLFSQYAVIDQQDPSTNLVANNKSYSTACGYEVYYGVGQTFPTEVVSASLPDFPALPSVSGANIQFLNSNCTECTQSSGRSIKQSKTVDIKKYKQLKKELLSKRFRK